MAPTENTQLTTSSKPNIAKTILQEQGMEAALDGKLVISICAGVTIAQLQTWVPKTAHVVRAMPNTPCKVRYPLSCGHLFPPPSFFSLFGPPRNLFAHTAELYSLTPTVARVIARLPPNDPADSRSEKE